MKLIIQIFAQTGGGSDQKNTQLGIHINELEMTNGLFAIKLYVEILKSTIIQVNNT